MDKALTFNNISIGHGLGGREDVIPSEDRASVSTGESELLLYASPFSLTSGSTGGSLVEE
jgi:hypothetical protein